LSLNQIKIGIVTVSDRASRGEYADRGGPAIEAWLNEALATKFQAVKSLVPDEQEQIEEALKNLSDNEGCCLVVTTGGTGPAKRDITPEATLAISEKVMDGFGELMRSVSLKVVPTAILSRQTAVIRGNTLIINLPGNPSAIGDCLNAVFPAVPTCIRLLEGPELQLKQKATASFSATIK